MAPFFSFPLDIWKQISYSRETWLQTDDSGTHWRWNCVFQNGERTSGSPSWLFPGVVLDTSGWILYMLNNEQHFWQIWGTAKEARIDEEAWLAWAK